MKRFLPHALLLVCSVTTFSCKSKSNILPHKRLNQEEKNAETTDRIAKVDGFILATAEPFSERTPGQKIEETQSASIPKGTAVMSAMGSNLNGTSQISITQKFLTEVVSPDLLRISIIKKFQETTLKFDENKQVIPDLSSLTGEVIPLTRVNGKWELDKTKWQKPLAGRAKEEVQNLIELKNRNADFEIFGATARKIGETWTTNVAPDVLSEGLTGLKSTWNITFKSVEMFQDTRCAVLEGPIEMFGKITDGQSQTSYSGTLTVYRALDQRINLKSEFKGKASLEVGMGKGSILRINGPIQATTSAQIK